MVLVGPCIEGRIEAADDDAAAGAVGDRVRLGVPRQDQRRRETRACGSTVGGWRHRRRIGRRREHGRVRRRASAAGEETCGRGMDVRGSERNRRKKSGPDSPAARPQRTNAHPAWVVREVRGRRAWTKQGKRNKRME
jgi:hypothetical protein